MGLALPVSLNMVLAMVLPMVFAMFLTLLSVWEPALGLSLELYAVPAQPHRSHRQCRCTVPMGVSLTMILALVLPLLLHWTWSLLALNHLTFIA